MSLISPKNFSAPFTNKVHLVTILLLSTVFATYRLAGGALESRRRGEIRRMPVSQPAPQRKSISDIFGSGNNDAQRGTVRRADSGEESSLGDLLKPAAKSTEKPKPAPNRLEDIEQQLGLR